jgi:hypothetical protein
MRSPIAGLFALAAMTILLFFVLDYADSLKVILPAYQLLKENIVVVVTGVGILIAVMVIRREPRVRSR